jgi:GTP-binding protein
MPGYGFAKAPKDMQRQWRYLVNDFLRGRDVLKRALVLIDSRHGIKDVDNEILDMLDSAAVSYRIVLTKTDKIKATELAEVRACAPRPRRASAPPRTPTSSLDVEREGHGPARAPRRRAGGAPASFWRSKKRELAIGIYSR